MVFTSLKLTVERLGIRLTEVDFFNSEHRLVLDVSVKAGPSWIDVRRSYV